MKSYLYPEDKGQLKTYLYLEDGGQAKAIETSEGNKVIRESEYSGYIDKSRAC